MRVSSSGWSVSDQQKQKSPSTSSGLSAQRSLDNALSAWDQKYPGRSEVVVPTPSTQVRPGDNGRPSRQQPLPRVWNARMIQTNTRDGLEVRCFEQHLLSPATHAALKHEKSRLLRQATKAATVSRSNKFTISPGHIQGNSLSVDAALPPVLQRRRAQRLPQKQVRR